MNKKKSYSDEFKVKIVLETIRGELTLSQISKKHGIHPTQISNWKKQFLDNAAIAFSGGRSKADLYHQEEVDELHRQIGIMKVENDWLKKKTDPFYKG